MLFEQLRWTLFALITISVVGVAGYTILEGWTVLDSLWMVVITLTTIGYGEVHQLSDAGRLFTIALVTVGIGLATVTLGQFSSYVVDGTLLTELRARRRRRIMEKLKDHVIVIGSGRLGREVTAELIHRGTQVVLIDSAEDVLEASRRQMGQAVATLELVGDGSDDELLEKAGIHQARAVAIATGSDATNVFVTLTARHLNPGLHIVTRVDETHSVAKAIRAGADNVINPYGIGGVRMAQGLLNPHAAQLLDQATGRSNAEFEIEDVLIGEVPAYNGPLCFLDIPGRHGILLLALRTKAGDLLTTMGRDTELSPGDIAVVVGPPAMVRAFSRAAQGLGETKA